MKRKLVGLLIFWNNSAKYDRIEKSSIREIRQSLRKAKFLIINIYWINGFYAKFKAELNLPHLLKDNYMVFGENESF